MKRLLLIGDPHITPQSIPYMGRMLREFVPGLALDQRCDHIVVMGDLYDNHKIASVEVREFWGSVLSYWNTLGLTCTLLSGNHDADQDCRWSWVRHHEDVPGVSTVTVPGAWEMARGLFAAPYVRKTEEFLQILKTLPKDARFLLCHQEFIGCDYGNGHFSKVGVPTEALPSGLTVISGHIHKSQALFRGNQIAVLYTGSSRHVSRAEEGNVTALTVLDLETEHFERHEVPESVVPRFRTYSVTGPEQLSTLPKIPASHLTLRIGDGTQTQEEMERILSVVPAGARTIVVRPKRTAAPQRASEPVRLRLERYAVVRGEQLGLSQTERQRLTEVLAACLPQAL